MFKDIELKLNFYKERIIKDFIKKGIYPDNSLIQSKLNNIDFRLSIFKKIKIKEGSYFNAKDINECINNIYEDLNILYELLLDITQKEYLNLKYYVKSHLNELQSLSEVYLKRAELETFSTSLGKSILFKYNKFDINKKDNTTIINLGQIEVQKADQIICIAKLNNTTYNNMLFNLKQVDETLTCNLYNYNHSTLTIPGEKNKILYETSINESQKINGIIKLAVKPESVDSNFVTLCGKDKILYKKADKTGEIIEEKPIGINSLSFNTHSYIDFYVVNGSGISFRFNKKPISTNFNINNNKIKNLNYIHHFFIECDENFSFDFELERGFVYAIKENTIIEKNELYYSGNIDIKDFLIIQTLNGDPIKYNANIEIYNQDITEEDIEGIIIKKV